MLGAPAVRSPLFLLLAMLACLPRATDAQGTSILTLLPTDDRVLAVGSEHTGALSSSDYTGADGEYLEAWALEGQMGASVALVLQASAFAGELVVVGPGLPGPLRASDNGYGSAPCVDFAFLESGTFHVVVTSSDSRATGAYTLLATESPAGASGGGCEALRDSDLLGLPTEGRELSTGSVEIGRLEADDPRVRDEYAEAWSLVGQAGETVTITMESDDFDTYLYLIDASGVIEQNDDGGSGTDSRITVTLSDNGPFAVVATAYSGNGSYSIRVEAGSVTSDFDSFDSDPNFEFLDPGYLGLPTEGRELSAGSAETASLGPDDPMVDGEYAEAWSLIGQEGETVTITMESDDFDTYLYLIDGPLGIVDYDDDGAGGTDSRLTATLSGLGPYTVVTTAYSGSGAYTLRVEEGSVSADSFGFSAPDLDLLELPTEDRLLTPGSVETGRLGPEDPSTRGEYAEAWALDAQTGDRVSISMQSGEFDTYLYLIGPQGVIAQDDDGGAAGTDSRIEATLTEGGPFVVIATAYSGDGAYTLRVGDIPRFHEIVSVESSTGGSDLFPARNLIQGPGYGFNGVGPFDKLITGSRGNWVTAADAGAPADYIAEVGMPVLVFDLGEDVDLAEISVWGYDSGNANGVSAYSLRFGTDADGPEGFGTSIAYNPTFELTNNDPVRQSESFDERVIARYVELTVEDNFFVEPGDGSRGGVAGGDRVGLGEIAFQVVDDGSDPPEADGDRGQITWSAPSNTTDSRDVRTDGTLVEAVNAAASNGGTVTVNGVVFSNSAELLDGSTNERFLNSGTTGDPGYDGILQTLDLGNGPNEVTLEVARGLLRPGTDYLIQVWWTDARRCCENPRQMAFGDGRGNTVTLEAWGRNSLGQYAVGSFTADDTMLRLTLDTSGRSGFATSGNAHITAYQIRSLGSDASASAPPQPSGANLNQALLSALLDRDAEAARRALAEGADPNGSFGTGGDAMTALFVAADAGFLEGVSVLLENGADPSTPAALAYGVEGMTPLMQAADRGSLEIVRALLEAGADPNATVDIGGVLSMTALSYALDAGHRAVADLLIEHRDRGGL